MQSITRKILMLGSIALTLFACDFAAAQRPMVGPFAGAARYESMPMLSRPNRLGHVYGNTMRRRYDRQTNYSPQPVRRATNYSVPASSVYGTVPAYNSTFTPYYAPANQAIVPAQIDQAVVPATWSAAEPQIPVNGLR